MTATRLAARALIRLSPMAEGEDVRGFLQGLVTNDVSGALPVWAGLLTPQGKALFDFIVWPAPDGELLIDCEGDAADDLARRLAMYRLRRRIAVARDDTLAVHWRADGGDAHDGGAAADPRLAALGRRWIAPASSAAGDDPADAAWRAHRLGHGVAEGRDELGDGQTLWLECNAAELAGVSFAKGCYVGQENTARMNWRSKVNRRLVVVPLPASDESRRRAAYPELGLAVDHLRVDAIAPAWRPGWMGDAATAE